MRPEKPIPLLRGRRIAITGAGRGLGRALALVAADHGAETVLLGRDPQALVEVANLIRARCGGDPLVVPCDLSMPDSIFAACDAILEKDSNIDILVNNAAPWLEGRLDDILDAEIASTISAAVTGTILITKRLLPGLHRSNSPDIITIVSTSGIPGLDLGGGSVPFYAAKHGQSGFSDKLRQELKGTGIRVSAIYPPDFDDADPTDDDWHMMPEDSSKISARDVVSAILFILSSPRTCNFPVVVLGALN